MFARACYLRKVIDHFVMDDDDRKPKQRLAKYKLSEREWEMCELLVTILLPFKKASSILQSASRPAIDEVFWTYEMLFNKIDMLKATFSLKKYRDKDWVYILHTAVDAMAAKLRKYYTKINKPFVYPNSVILEPRGKLVLFKQEMFDAHYTETYSDACREHYITHYELVAQQPAPVNSPTLKRKLADIEEEQNDYRAALNKVAASRVTHNEYDRYLTTESPTGTTLESWKQLQPALPRLALMARDTFAVPATGAGVERQFSKSGRIDTWARNRMNPGTVCESMKFNDYLRRSGTPLVPGKRRRLWSELVHPAAKDADENDENENSDTDENKIEILEWEKEWWQKVDAKLSS
jgi:hypothetical protein